MKINPEIFKAYDIRGIYPSQINEKVSYLIGRALVLFLKKKNPKIVVGRDNRLSSPSLFKNLIQGILDQGGEVIDIGLSTTPLLYFATAHWNYDGGVQITASHNPPKYNGFKLVKKEAFPISEKTGILEIKKLVIKGKFGKKRKGKIQKKKVLDDYLKFNFDLVDLKKIKPQKIVIDSANAVSGIWIPKLAKKIKAKVFHLFFQLDGSFPNHLPNPLIKENLKDLQKEVKTKKANLGVAFDGDGDRIIFVDEKGKIVSGDLIGALLSSILLRDNPGAKILYDLRSSNVLPETIKKLKGLPIQNRIGHSFIKERMRKEKALFSSELSGHYYLRDLYFCEAPLFVLLKILEEISEKNKKLSELISPFIKYFHSGEINFKIKDKEKIIKLLRKKYRLGKITLIDGIRIDFKDFWFLVRPSQTEPILRLVVEAKTKELMQKKKKELSLLIKTCS